MITTKKISIEYAQMKIRESKCVTTKHELNKTKWYRVYEVEKSYKKLKKKQILKWQTKSFSITNYINVNVISQSNTIDWQNE